MHIFGLLTLIASILFLLDRLGVDIGWLNPWHWRRRRAWSKQYHGDPIFSVEDPLHIASLLIIGVAKIEGDLTAEQKQAVKSQFSNRFSLSDKESSDLIGSAAHLLAAPQLVGDQLKTLAQRNKERFSSDQAESMLTMMDEVASAEGRLTEEQREYVATMRSLFVSKPQSDGAWD